MNGFQFALAIVGSLAWPACLVAIALMLRPQKSDRK